MVTTLAALQHATDDTPGHVSLVLPDIGGGRMSRETLDTLDAHPTTTSITISGLDQRSLEEFVTRFGARFTALHLWKCPRIQELAPLEHLPQLAVVAIYWNQRTSRLWNLSRTPALRGLMFEDFTRLRSLDDVSHGSALEELEFGNKIWNTAVFNSLEPLAALVGLRRLAFSAKRIEDGLVEPLGALQRLHTLDFSANLFTTEQVAWLRAHLPASTNGVSLCPLRTFDSSLLNGKDVLIVGKRKPFLNSTRHAKRIERYVADFARLVARFAADPTARP